MRINRKKMLAALVAATTVFSSVAPSYVYGAEDIPAAEAEEAVQAEEGSSGAQAEEEPAGGATEAAAEVEEKKETE